MEKQDVRLKLNKLPPRFDTLRIMRFQCGFPCHLLQQHQENSFRAQQKIYTTSIILSYSLSSLQGTKYVRCIGISNIFICLRGFLLFLRCFSLLTPFPSPPCTAHACQAFQAA
jgi:hypothetical protein